FFELVDYLAARRKERPTARRAVVRLTVTSDEFRQHWFGTRRSAFLPRLVLQLMQHEHPLRLGSGGYNAEDGSWSTDVTRWILPFAGLETIEGYVVALEELLGRPPALAPVLPSPLSLSASLDFLN